MQGRYSGLLRSNIELGMKWEKSWSGMSRRIAIIGAGIAGLAAAQQLKQPDFGMTLIEKSRGVGGRMATRRINDLQYDHGAQYFSAW